MLISYPTIEGTCRDLQAQMSTQLVLSSSPLHDALSCLYASPQCPTSSLMLPLIRLPCPDVAVAGHGFRAELIQESRQPFMGVGRRIVRNPKLDTNLFLSGVRAARVNVHSHTKLRYSKECSHGSRLPSILFAN